MNPQQWLDKGELININGNKLFVIDSDKQSHQPVLVILHGYPTCSYDYYKALPHLSKYFRVIIHDHLGFGYSDKPLDYSYSLIQQADYALGLWEKLGIKQAHILAHDYGTSVATEIVARNNENKLDDFNISSLVLCNGSMHIELAQLRLIQKLLLNPITGPVVAALTNKKILEKNLKNIYFDKTKITSSEIDALWTMMTHNNGKAVLHKVTQYIKQRYTYWNRWIGALRDTDLPIEIVWAKNDPVAILKIAETIHQETKNSRLTVLGNLGHFPMLEDPERWANSVMKRIKLWPN